MVIDHRLNGVHASSIGVLNFARDHYVSQVPTRAFHFLRVRSVKAAGLVERSADYFSDKRSDFLRVNQTRCKGAACNPTTRYLLLAHRVRGNGFARGRHSGDILVGEDTRGSGRRGAPCEGPGRALWDLAIMHSRAQSCGKCRGAKGLVEF